MVKDITNNIHYAIKQVDHYLIEPVLKEFHAYKLFKSNYRLIITTDRRYHENNIGLHVNTISKY